MQLSQRTRAKPCANPPHSRYLAKSRSTYRGRPLPSGERNPARSRVLMRLALTRTKDPAQLQRYLQEY
ncbi:MAG TPA: hypothetical protein VEY88_18805 [Archangium sp.]|nr:hypothetical protein [Archangium sp.]